MHSPNDPTASEAMTSIVRAAVVVVTLALFFGAILNALTGQRDLAVIFAFGAPLGIAAWSFARAGYGEAALSMLCFVLILVVTLVLMISPLGVHDVAVTGYGGVVLTGALLLARRFFYIILGLVVFAAVGAFLFERYGLSRSLVPHQANWLQLGELLAILATFAILGRHAAETLFGRLGDAHSASNQDALTGFRNRASFLARAATALKATRNAPECDLLIVADLDDFRRVNTVIGHRAADAVLKEASHRFANATGGHLRGRIGDDEFAVLALGLPDEAAAEQLARAAHAALTFEYSGVSVRSSLGYALSPRDGVGVEALLLAAEGALAQAKEREGVHFAAAERRI